MRFDSGHIIYTEEVVTSFLARSIALDTWNSFFAVTMLPSITRPAKPYFYLQLFIKNACDETISDPFIQALAIISTASANFLQPSKEFFEWPIYDTFVFLIAPSNLQREDNIV